MARSTAWRREQVKNSVAGWHPFSLRRKNLMEAAMKAVGHLRGCINKPVGRIRCLVEGLLYSDRAVAVLCDVIFVRLTALPHEQMTMQIVVG
jgi:hypothetical protein